METCKKCEQLASSLALAVAALEAYGNKVGLGGIANEALTKLREKHPELETPYGCSPEEA